MSSVAVLFFASQTYNSSCWELDLKEAAPSAKATLVTWSSVEVYIVVHMNGLSSVSGTVTVVSSAE